MTVALPQNGDAKPQISPLSLLNLLGDLQSHHSDLLLQLSSKLHEAANLVKYRAQELGDQAFKTRKESWELKEKDAWYKKDYGYVKDTKMVNPDPSSSNLQCRINCEIHDGAADMEAFTALENLITSIVKAKQPNIISNKKTVYEHIKDDKNNKFKNPMDMICELAAEKVFKSETHIKSNENLKPSHDQDVNEETMIAMENSPGVFTTHLFCSRAAHSNHAQEVEKADGDEHDDNIDTTMSMSDNDAEDSMQYHTIMDIDTNTTDDEYPHEFTDHDLLQTHLSSSSSSSSPSSSIRSGTSTSPYSLNHHEDNNDPITPTTPKHRDIGSGLTTIINEEWKDGLDVNGRDGGHKTRSSARFGLVTNDDFLGAAGLAFLAGLGRGKRLAVERGEVRVNGVD